MRFLTVKQPYAWALFHGKDVENRSQLFKYRGPVGIHAGASWHQPGGEDPMVVAAARLAGGDVRPTSQKYGPDFLLPGPEFPTGVVVGVVALVGCHTAEPGCCTSPWAQHYPKATHLEFTDATLLPDPIPARGRLGLWCPDPDNEADPDRGLVVAVRAALEAEVA